MKILILFITLTIIGCSVTPSYDSYYRIVSDCQNNEFCIHYFDNGNEYCIEGGTLEDCQGFMRSL